MKALAMLDHVMLWVARMFTAGLLVLVLFPIVMLGFYFVLELFEYMALPRSAIDKPFYVFNLSLHQQLERPRSLVNLPFIILIFACVRYLQSIYARICLGLSASFFVVCFGSAAIALRHLHGTPVFAITYLIGVFGLLGFASLLWVSIRPGEDASPSDPNLTAIPSPHSC